MTNILASITTSPGPGSASLEVASLATNQVYTLPNEGGTLLTDTSAIGSTGMTGATGMTGIGAGVQLLYSGTVPLGATGGTDLTGFLAPNASTISFISFTPSVAVSSTFGAGIINGDFVSGQVSVSGFRVLLGDIVSRYVSVMMVDIPLFHKLKEKTGSFGLCLTTSFLAEALTVKPIFILIAKYGSGHLMQRYLVQTGVGLALSILMIPIIILANRFLFKRTDMGYTTMEKIA